MMFRIPMLVCLPLIVHIRTVLAVAKTYQYGMPDCPCVEWAGLDNHRSNGKLVVRPNGAGGPTYYYQSDYGNGECKAWDKGLEPNCAGTNPPAYCASPWCYVHASCKQTKSKSSNIGFDDAYKDENIYWSFATCAQSNSYETVSIKKILDVMEGYLRSMRDSIQTSYNSIHKNNALTACTYSAANTCKFGPACSKCQYNAHWAGKFDFSQTMLLMQNSLAANAKAISSCMAKAIDTIYQKIATKESNVEKNSRGYLYFGDQDSGSYMQWPQQEECYEKSYDPRYRPWYSGGATGPKDVIIIVDVSRSMARNGRSTLARQAAKKIIDTLTWKDFAGIVLFHSSASTYSTYLQPMGEANRAKMKQWCDTGDWAVGQTKFGYAFDEAFALLERSIDSGQTSMCQKMIMFLTDGEDDSFDGFAKVKTQALKYDAFILSYSLGGQADLTKPKQLACENRGIFYKVDDNADLSKIMSRYYEYFAAGQEICTPSYIKYAATDGQEYYSGCLPSYHREAANASLVGVSCMDLSVLGKISELKKQKAWEHLVCKMSDHTKFCRPFTLDECQREKLRAKIGADSVCNSQGISASAIPLMKCGCFSRSCVDDSTFVDEGGYMCHAWIGDNCETDGPRWGLSPAGVTQLLKKCPRSCNKCTWHAQCPYTDAKDCIEASAGPSTCTACTSLTSGVDILGNPMTCDTGPTYECKTKGTGPGCTAKSSSDDGGGNMGIIIGAAVAVIAVLGCCGVAFIFMRGKSRNGGGTSKPTEVSPSVPPPPPPPFVPQAAAVAAPPMVVPAPVHVPQPVAAPVKVGKMELLDFILPPGAAASGAELTVPSTWTHQSLSSPFQTITETDAGINVVLQEMINDTWKATSTRDRTGTMPEKLIVQMVQRVENSAMWKTYIDAKVSIKGKRPHRCTSIEGGGKTIKTMEKKHDILTSLDRGVNEVFLWHGTSPSAAASIAKTGFNVNLAGSTTGTMYGNGVYLAEASSKSDEYAKADEGGIFPNLYCLLLCRVVLGEALTMGAGGSKVHNTIYTSLESGAFECVIGDREAAVGKYREFIVYTGAQVYPEYIVMYKRA